jgi:hypothetical protein
MSSAPVSSSVSPVSELSKYVLIFLIGGQKSPISFVKNSGLYNKYDWVHLNICDFLSDIGEQQKLLKEGECHSPLQ